MKTRTHRPAEEIGRSILDDEFTGYDLEALSDEELEHMLFEEEPPKSGSFLNLPTVAGLSLILVGIAYIFQEMGIWNGFDVSVLASMLPWLAGVLIILLGFGVLSWRPKKRVKVKARKEKASKKAKNGVDVRHPSGRKSLTRSREKKLAGVAAGIAEYFNIDPTLVRIAFVFGTIASGGPFLLAYVILAFVMPKPEELAVEERITIIRDR